jgi:hypothetical protein
MVHVKTSQIIRNDPLGGKIRGQPQAGAVTTIPSQPNVQKLKTFQRKNLCVSIEYFVF